MKMRISKTRLSHCQAQESGLVFSHAKTDRLEAQTGRVAFLTGKNVSITGGDLQIGRLATLAGAENAAELMGHVLRPDDDRIIHQNTRLS